MGVTRCAAVFLFFVLAVAAAPAQTAYVPGVFVGTGKGPVELIAWAEVTRKGTLRMTPDTSIEDVPTVDTVQRILCSMPDWKPRAVWLAGNAIFEDERAERRLLASTQRSFNVYTVELRVPDLEDPGTLERLAKQVRSKETDPAYVFIPMDNNLGVVRYYMARLR
jgi:hypothetical protein